MSDVDEVVVLQPMTAKEARQYVEEIKGHLEGARRLLLDLYERKGWEILGYQNWRDCAVAEFGQHTSYLYRQLKAAQIEREVSPMGEIGQIPERQLRPLSKLPQDQWKETWNESERTAPNGVNTAAHVAQTVDRVTQRNIGNSEELPPLDELFALYAQIAEKVEHQPTQKYRNQFMVERSAYPSFTLKFLGRGEAWKYWQSKYSRYSHIPVERQMLKPGYPLIRNERQCTDCDHCEDINGEWYCNLFKENYKPSENPAARCERFKDRQAREEYAAAPISETIDRVEIPESESESEPEMEQPAAYTTNPPTEELSNLWQTQRWVLDLVSEVLEGIDLDPTADRTKRVPAKQYFTIEDDCLKQVWNAQTVFMNPPFSPSNPFMVKFCQEFAAGHFQEGITLTLDNPLHNQGSQPHIEPLWSTLCFWRGRMPFESPVGKQGSGFDRDVTLVYFGNRLERFRQVFKQYGMIAINPIQR